MRAHSNWSVASNWTEPKVITRAELEGRSFSKAYKQTAVDYSARHCLYLVLALQ